VYTWPWVVVAAGQFGHAAVRSGARRAASRVVGLRSPHGRGSMGASAHVGSESANRSRMCMSASLLTSTWRYDAGGARIGDRLAEVLMLVPEKGADRIFLGHVLAEQFPRRLEVGVRKSVDGFLQVA